MSRCEIGIVALAALSCVEGLSISFPCSLSTVTTTVVTSKNCTMHSNHDEGTPEVLGHCSSIHGNDTDHSRTPSIIETRTCLQNCPCCSYRGHYECVQMKRPEKVRYNNGTEAELLFPDYCICLRASMSITGLRVCYDWTFNFYRVILLFFVSTQCCFHGSSLQFCILFFYLFLIDVFFLRK